MPHDPVQALDAPLSEDLAPVARWLAANGVAHHFHERAGRQVLLVRDTAAADTARQAYAAWQRGELASPAPAPRGAAQAALRRLWQQLPVTLVLVLLALAAWPVAWGLDGQTPRQALGLLTLVPVEFVRGLPWAGTLADTLASGQWWRLWTPALLHFSALHLVGNLVMVWYLGQRIETVLGSGRLLLLVLGLGVTANLGQYLLDTGPLFGGLSGVVYGLFGYLLVLRRHADLRLHLPAGLAVMLLLSLVLFSTGALGLVGVHVANGAHWAGFAAGILAGWLGHRSDPLLHGPVDD